MLAKQQELGKDLGKCGFEISQGNNDRTANEQEYVVSIQEGTSRCRAALLDLAEGSSCAVTHRVPQVKGKIRITL